MTIVRVRAELRNARQICLRLEALANVPTFPTCNLDTELIERRHNDDLVLANETNDKFKRPGILRVARVAAKKTILW